MMKPTTICTGAQNVLDNLSDELFDLYQKAAYNKLQMYVQIQN